ncbi:MAG TPA: hypothetical protein PK990_09575, partial [Salinivirgaceae bacterium]|nr:hypothetical protein [Salinivirgaceae bacterium]
MKTFKLSFPKIYYLIERYVMLNKKSIVITASSLTGVLVALCLLNTWAGNHVFSVDYFVLQA